MFCEKIGELVVITGDGVAAAVSRPLWSSSLTGAFLWLGIPGGQFLLKQYKLDQSPVDIVTLRYLIGEGYT